MSDFFAIRSSKAASRDFEQLIARGVANPVPIAEEVAPHPPEAGQSTGRIFTVPVYCLPDPRNSSLSNALRFGWRLVFIDEGRAVSADYVRNSSKRPSLARLNVAAGKFVKLLEQVVHEIDQERPSKRYHLRLLSVPSLSWNGLWLATKDGASDKVYTGDGKQISEEVLIATLGQLAANGVALTNTYKKLVPSQDKPSPA